MDELIKSIASSIEYQRSDIIAKTNKKITSTLRGGMNSTVSLETNTRGSVENNKPVLQLNQFPMTINGDDYKNALSTSNPNGDIRPLFALRQLVDPIPSFVQHYNASAYSTEGMYENILNGAVTSDESSFTMSILSQAKKKFEENTFSSMDGTPGDWRAVYANPEDWATADISRYKNLSIDLNNSSSDSPFAIIPSTTDLQWNFGDSSTQQMNPTSKINKLSMKYLFVELRRPWFDLLLFNMNDWYLSGQSIGFCSSGSSQTNNGVFPLFPTGMLIAKDIELDGDWHTDDRSILNRSMSGTIKASLGPFSITPKTRSSSTSSQIQIIGWVSELIPMSPMVSKK